MEKKFSLGQKLNTTPKLPGGAAHEIRALPNQAATRHDTLANMKAKATSDVHTFNALESHAPKVPGASELAAAKAKLEQKNLSAKFGQIKSVD